MRMMSMLGVIGTFGVLGVSAGCGATHPVASSAVSQPSGEPSLTSTPSSSSSSAKTASGASTAAPEPSKPATPVVVGYSPVWKPLPGIAVGPIPYTSIGSLIGTFGPTLSPQAKIWSAMGTWEPIAITQVTPGVPMSSSPLVQTSGFSPFTNAQWATISSALADNQIAWFGVRAPGRAPGPLYTETPSQISAESALFTPAVPPEQVVKSGGVLGTVPTGFFWANNMLDFGRPEAWDAPSLTKAHQSWNLWMEVTFTNGNVWDGMCG